jgi:hypothetical protein
VDEQILFDGFKPVPRLAGTAQTATR